MTDGPAVVNPASRPTPREAWAAREVAAIPDSDQMTVKELRRLTADLAGVPDEATFSLGHLANRGALLASWEEPAGSGKTTGVHLARACNCGHADCPDKDLF